MPSRLLLPFAALLLAGCAPPRADVTGTVTFKGQAVTSGTVTLYSDAGPRSGIIGPDGRYTVRRVAPGPHLKVTVASPDPEETTIVTHDGARAPADPEAARTWFPIP